MLYLIKNSVAMAHQYWANFQITLIQILFDEYYDDDDDDGEVIIPGKEKDGSKLRYHDQDDEHKIRHWDASLYCIVYLLYRVNHQVREELLLTWNYELRCSIVCFY